MGANSTLSGERNIPLQVFIGILPSSSPSQGEKNHISNNRMALRDVNTSSYNCCALLDTKSADKPNPCVGSIQLPCTSCSLIPACESAA